MEIDERTKRFLTGLCILIGILVGSIIVIPLLIGFYLGKRSAIEKATNKLNYDNNLNLGLVEKEHELEIKM